MFKVSVPTRHMMIVALSGLTAGIALLAPIGMAEAAARGVVVNEALAANAASAAPSDEARGAKPAKKYCTGRTPSGDTSVTGSILQRKVCKTREQWLAEGVKIEEK